MKGGTGACVHTTLKTQQKQHTTHTHTHTAVWTLAVLSVSTAVWCQSVSVSGMWINFRRKRKPNSVRKGTKTGRKTRPSQTAALQLNGSEQRKTVFRHFQSLHRTKPPFFSPHRLQWPMPLPQPPARHRHGPAKARNRHKQPVTADTTTGRERRRAVSPQEVDEGGDEEGEPGAAQSPHHQRRHSNLSEAQGRVQMDGKDHQRQPNGRAVRRHAQHCFFGGCFGMRLISRVMGDRRYAVASERRSGRL